MTTPEIRCKLCRWQGLWDELSHSNWDSRCPNCFGDPDELTYCVYPTNCLLFRWYEFKDWLWLKRVRIKMYIRIKVFKRDWIHNEPLDGHHGGLGKFKDGVKI